MNADTEQLAERVVDAFSDLLSSDARAAVGDSNLHALRDMIGEVITERSKNIFDRLEQNLKQAEAEMVERIPLEL